MTHALSLMAGGIGLISIYFIQDPSLLIVSMIGVGMAWASILAMPYAILAGSIPAHKMGVYMGIFNFFITFPQIVNGVIGGSDRQIFLSTHRQFTVWSWLVSFYSSRHSVSGLLTTKMMSWCHSLLRPNR